MKKMIFFAAVAVAVVPVFAEVATLLSPNGQIIVKADVGKSLSWSVMRKGETIIAPSELGLEFKGQKPFGEMVVSGKSEKLINNTWTNRLYKKEEIVDHANELTLELTEKDEPKRKLNLVFRAYDGAVAFRYVIPAQPGFEKIVITKENTTWAFEKDYLGWLTVYNAHKTSQEEPFLHRSIRSVPPKQLIGMPAVIEVGSQRVALCEADLTRWSGMFFRTPARKDTPSNRSVLCAELSPRLDKQGLVVTAAPCQSPWRVMILGDSALELIANNDVILNLNPPPEGGDEAFAWVKPGATGWDWWVDSNNTLTKELTLEQIDFASEMGWPYHTIDGGWYGRGEHTKLDTQKLDPLPELDFPAIFARAKEKNVGIWLWVYWSVLEANDPDKTFEKFAKWGVKGVKIDFMDRQDQWMVEWYEKIVRLAAKHKIMINYHGAYKPTGMNRTWPNQVTREGILGVEMVKFYPSVTPEHCATLPFTRFLLGPGDYTPCSFANVHGKDFLSQAKRGHRYADLSPESKASKIYATEIGTRAHAIALAIAYDSPLMTLCDWPERYRGQAGLEAIRKLPTVWKHTFPLDGEIGKSYTVVRETYDNRFYLASFGVDRMKVEVALSFLPEGKWTAMFFVDGDNAEEDATSIKTYTREVTNLDKIDFATASEGGAVVIFEKK